MCTGAWSVVGGRQAPRHAHAPKTPVCNYIIFTLYLQSKSLSNEKFTHNRQKTAPYTPLTNFSLWVWETLLKLGGVWGLLPHVENFGKLDE